jgi:hypothetical protein
VGGKEKARRLVAAGAAVVLLVQFARPELLNPPIIADFDSPPEVRRILRRPCYDCHFNETRLAWFDRIVPVYWIVARDGGAARANI